MKYLFLIVVAVLISVSAQDVGPGDPPTVEVVCTGDIGPGSEIVCFVVKI